MRSRGAITAGSDLGSVGPLPDSKLSSEGEHGTAPIFLLSRVEAKWLTLGSLAFAFIFFFPIFFDGSVSGAPMASWLLSWPHLRFNGGVPGDGDRDVFMQLRWVPYYTLTHFHQFPFWSPYKCGGMSMVGNPEGSTVTPFILPYLLFGMASGVIFEIYLHLAIMFAGGYVLGRELGLRPLACTALAAMFPSSSWLSLHVGVGHLNFLSIAYMPWVLALLLATCRTKRWFPSLLGGLLCALTLTEGNYGFVFTAMLVTILAIALVIFSLSLRPLASAFLIGLFAVAFGSLKLIPTAELLRTYPRELLVSWQSWWSVVVSLFSRYQDINHEMLASFFFWEYAGYIGAPFAVLALIGTVSNWRQASPWVLGCIIFLLLYRGDTGPNALVVWMRELPLGGNTGLCGRWAVPLVFCVGVLAALGVDALCARPGTWGHRLALIMVTVGIIDAWLVCAPGYRYVFRSPYEPPVGLETFRQFWNDSPGGMYAANQSNMGAVNCGCCGYHVPYEKVRGYNQHDYRGEFYLLGAGEVKQTMWTPNRLGYQVNLPAATSLVINQNTYPGWRVVRGEGETYSEGGLMAVRVPPGQERIELEYRPTHVNLAYLLTFLATALTVLMWFIEKRQLPERPGQTGNRA
jgi:hypothetical protein